MKWLNLVLAMLGSLAAFGALNKMHVSSTRPCIIGAFLLIALGLAGQWLSLVHEQWLLYVDAALYGGILALTVASQRHHTWFLERWANPIASAIVLAVGVVFLGGLLTGCAAAPQGDGVLLNGVCYHKSMGRTEDGMSVTYTFCVDLQTHADAQK